MEGSVTTIVSNPIWVIQTSQAVQTMNQDSSQRRPVSKRLSVYRTILNLLESDGIGAFWRGVGPALVLVVNPVLQYTVFEQLKNSLIVRRTEKLRAAGLVVAIAVLSDWDFFFLGAISKLGDRKPIFHIGLLALTLL
jgi:adenine nucleotide transporter 17